MSDLQSFFTLLVSHPAPHTVCSHLSLDLRESQDRVQGGLEAAATHCFPRGDANANPKYAIGQWP